MRGQRGQQPAQCRWCGAPIRWARLLAGGSLPVNLRTPPDVPLDCRVFTWRDGSLGAQVVADGAAGATHTVHKCPRRPSTRGPRRHNPKGRKPKAPGQLDLFE